MQGLIEALTSQNWVEIHEATKKEASRQSRIMENWLKLAKEYDLPELSYDWIEGAIGKSVKYRYKIFNGNKQIKPIDQKLARLRKTDTSGMTQEELAKLQAEFLELSDQRAEIESEQVALAFRIVKIFCAVGQVVVLATSKEDIEELYDDQEMLPE